MAILVSDIISYARTVTDHDATDTQITDAQLIVLLNPLYMRVRRRVGQAVPTLYTKVPANFTISSGNTQDVTASPLSLTDFDRVRKILRVVNGAASDPVGVANDIQPEQISSDQDYCFLERGTVLEFYPSAVVPGQTFQLQYVSQPVAIAAVGNTIDLPEGFQEVLGEYLASKIRLRFEEQSTVHVAVATDILKQLLLDLITRYGVEPNAMNEGGVR